MVVMSFFTVMKYIMYQQAFNKKAAPRMAPLFFQFLKHLKMTAQN
jgi:hypothetical protein